MSSSKPAAWLAPLVLLACAPLARGAQEPHIEFGVGAIAVRVPDYRGSDRHGDRIYPVPFVNYQSANVQLSREGLRAKVFSLERLTGSLSANVNLTGHASNPDRAGMPRLHPTLEVGPSLDYRLADYDDVQVRARLPLRAVISSDGFTWTGAVAAPQLLVSWREALPQSRLYWLASAGGLWGSSEYHQYYYGVDTAYATTQRPAYDASSGYSGARATLSSTWRMQDWSLGAFTAYDALSGAAFEDSPLVKTDHSLLAGVFVCWWFFERGGRREP